MNSFGNNETMIKRDEYINVNHRRVMKGLNSCEVENII